MADHPHERAQKKFYDHLRMHPNAYKSAQSFAQKLVNRDAEAIALLRALSSKAATDPKAANAVRILAVTMKFEKPTPSMGTIISGGLPAAGGKIIKAALTPAAWVLSQSGNLFHWAGRQFQHISQTI